MRISSCSISSKSVKSYRSTISSYLSAPMLTFSDTINLFPRSSAVNGVENPSPCSFKKTLSNPFPRKSNLFSNLACFPSLKSSARKLSTKSTTTFKECSSLSSFKVSSELTVESTNQNYLQVFNELAAVMKLMKMYWYIWSERLLFALLNSFVWCIFFSNTC